MKIIFINKAEEIRFFNVNENFSSQLKAFFYVKNTFETKIREFYIGNYDFSQIVLVKVDDFANLKAGGDLDVNLLNVICEYQRYQKAIAFAKEKHKKQKYSELNLPYFYHLRQVDKVLDYFFYELPMNYYFMLKICAILHDTVEDTGTKVKEIADNFGKEIAEIVNKVSKKKKITRRWTDKCYFKQMGDSPFTIMVKIADKCANFKQTKKNMNKHHVDRVNETYVPFKKMTYDKVDLKDMKEYLADIVSVINLKRAEGKVNK